MSEIVYKEQFKKIPDGYGYNGPNQTLELQKYKDKINKKIFRQKVFSGVTKNLGSVGESQDLDIIYLEKQEPPLLGPEPPQFLNIENESGRIRLDIHYVDENFNIIRIERSWNRGDFKEIALIFPGDQVRHDDLVGPSVYYDRPKVSGLYTYRIRVSFNSLEGPPSEPISLDFTV